MVVTPQSCNTGWDTDCRENCLFLRDLSAISVMKCKVKHFNKKPLNEHVYNLYKQPAVQPHFQFFSVTWLLRGSCLPRLQLMQTVEFWGNILIKYHNFKLRICCFLLTQHLFLSLHLSRYDKRWIFSCFSNLLVDFVLSISKRVSVFIEA